MLNKKIASKFNSKDEKENEEKYFQFFSEVVRRTAVMVAEWQCVGWCHGFVYFTDNQIEK